MVLINRSWRWGLGGALLALSLALPASAASPKILTIYFQWSPSAETLKKAAEIFEKRNPDIKVDIIPTCIDCGTGYEKLITAIAAGTPPDLVTLSGSYYVEMAQKGMLEPLSRYIAGTDWRTKYQPALWNTRVLDGEIYGLPAFEGGPGRGLIFNRDIVAESGVAAPREDAVMTWGEFGSMARKVARYDAQQRLSRVGYYPKEAGGNSVGSVSTAFGVDWFNERTGMAELDRPELVEGMEMIKRHFYDPWGYDAVEAAVKGKGMWTNHTNSLFATKGSATILVGYWAPGELKKTMPDGNIGVTWMPNNQRQKIQTIGSWNLTMLRDGRQKAEAWRLLQFFASPETTRLFFEDHGWLGGLHKDLPRYIDLKNSLGSRWYVQSLDTAQVVLSGTPNAYGALAGKLWNDVYEKVVSGKGAARQLLAEANRVLNASIAEDRQRQ